MHKFLQKLKDLENVQHFKQQLYRVLVLLICSLFLGNYTVKAQVPGVDWTLWNTENIDVDGNLIAYGNGRFVIINTGYVFTSSNGIDWTRHDLSPDYSGHSYDWYSITYGNGLFVAVGENGHIMTSPDGINWTINFFNPVGFRSFNAVTYGNGLFVAVARGASNGGGLGTIFTSPDGVNWTNRLDETYHNWGSIAYGNGLFVATQIPPYPNDNIVGTRLSNEVMVSNNGINWYSSSYPGNAISLGSVTYGNGLFVAVADQDLGSEYTVMTSPDGSNWTPRITPTDNPWNSITYNNGLFVAVSGSGTDNTSVMTSPDGINWTLRNSLKNNWRAVTYGNGVFVAVSDGLGGLPTNVMTSGVMPGPPIIRTNATTLTGLNTTYGTASSSASMSVSGTNMLDPITATAPASFELSLDNTVFNNVVNIGATGTTSATPLYVRLKSTTGVSNNISGTVTLTSTGATSVNISIPTSVVLPKAITVTADAKSKMSGNADPAFTYICSPALVSGDNFTGTLSRVSGENAGTYAITQGTLSAGNNYAITYVGANLTVTDWTMRSTPVSISGWNSITYGNGLFVAVSLTSAGVMTSPDGINWTKRVGAANYSWASVTYGNGLFVAVSNDGDDNTRIMTSPDGISWTLRTSPIASNGVNLQWNAVTYGNGVFVALSSFKSYVMTSSDGIAWTLHAITPAINNLWQWTSVTYGNGLFLAVSGSGEAMSSSDGTTWTRRTYGDPTNNDWTSVTYGNGLFVAVAQGSAGFNRIMTTPNGINFSRKTLSLSTGNSWTSVIYGNGLFVAVSPTGNHIMTSSDGATWKLVTPPADKPWQSIAYGDGLFVALGFDGSVMTSGVKYVAPVINANGTLAALSTTYGTASPSASTSVSGTNMLGPITATAPTGFELSLNNTTFSNTVSIGSTGTVSATTLYVRLKSNVGVGNNITGTIALTSSSATPVNINIPASVVSPKAITVTATAISKTSGRADPQLTYTPTPALLSGDNFTGTLSREVGETTGTYAITQGTLSAGSNYTITYVGANFTIGPPALGDYWLWRRPGQNLGGVKWFSTAYGNGIFVAVGQGLSAMSSPNGIDWTNRLTPNSNLWRSVTYGDGLFVAVTSNALGGFVMTSPDGMSWTARRSMTGNETWSSVTYGNGLFVAVGGIDEAGNEGPDRVMTSPDGINWTVRTAPSGAWTSVIYGNNLYVATTHSSIITSPDGINWTKHALNAISDISSIAYGNGLFAATVSNGSGVRRIATSPDGINWTLNTLVANSDWSSITYSNGLFVAVASKVGSISADQVISSSDGINWAAGITDQPDSDYLWTSVTYGRGLFLALGTDGSVMTSGLIEAVPTISTNGALNILNTTYGAPSPSTSFSVSGIDMKGSIKATAPVGFELSTDDINFADEVSFGSTGAINATSLYVRLKNTTAVNNNITGAIKLTSSEAAPVLVNIPRSTVRVRGVVVTAEAKTKIRGNADPELTYTFSPALVPGDSFTGALSRDIGEYLGTYAIKQGNLSAGTNYVITYVKADLTITPIPPVVSTSGTLASLSTSYGIPSSSTSISISGTNTTEAVTAIASVGFELSKDNIIFKDTISIGAAGTINATALYVRLKSSANVGNNITGTVTLTNNGITPMILNIPASSVSRGVITVTADLKVKAYGDIDPILTYTCNPELIPGNYFTGALSRDAGEVSGSYAITQGSLSVGSNYVINFIGAELMINPPGVAIPGIVWKLQTTPVSEKFWKSITYGNGVFVALAGDGAVMASPDGVNWTLRNSSLDVIDFADITYGNGIFVAVATGRYGEKVGLMTSVDGVNWTVKPTLNNTPLRAVTFGNGRFLALSDKSMMTSFDGINWTIDAWPWPGQPWDSITYGKGLFVVVSSNVVMTSPDGINWTEHRWNTSYIAYPGYSVTYGNGMFVAVGLDKILASPDGIDWTLHDVPGASWQSVTYGNGLFVAVGIDGIMTSLDGVYWTKQSSPTINSIWNSVTYGNGLFVALASNGNIMTSGISQTTPVISTNNSLTSLVTTYGTASPAAYIDVSGINISGNINAVASAGFEVGLSQSSYFDATYVGVPNEGGVVNPSRLYVRLKSKTSANNSIAGTITLTSNGATPVIMNIPTSVVYPKPISVTVQNASRCYATPNPTFPLTYSGFVNGENTGNLNSLPVASTSATINSNPGNYAISISGGQADNYTFNYVPGVLTITEPPVIGISSDKGIKVTKGTTVQLTATGGDTYQWEPASDIISGQNTSVLTVQPQSNTTYTVTATNTAGCSTQQSIQIEVVDIVTAELPNILTPNGDGVNDNWVVENIELYPNNQVKIFNAAGNVFYQKQDYDNSWNGTYNGSPLAEGTYYYIIDLGNGQSKLGFITIVGQQ